MKPVVDKCPNPPVNGFYPSAADPEARKMRNYQMYAHCWMESRIEFGGGIIGDEIGLGKVLTLLKGNVC